MRSSTAYSSNSREPRSHWLDWLDISNLDFFDAEGGCVFGLLIAALLGVVAVIGFALINGSSLIGEIFLDYFLVSIFYRRLRIAAREHWLGTAVRRTWKMALLTAGLMALARWCLQQLAPGA